jgi:ferritin-like metal-binding protein YciE
MAAKQALVRVKALKREQAKLKSTIENEFNAMKNCFYQLEEVMHADQTPAKSTATGADPQLVKEIYQEAASVERFFQEMERKKAAIM